MILASIPFNICFMLYSVLNPMQLINELQYVATRELTTGRKMGTKMSLEGCRTVTCILEPLEEAPAIHKVHEPCRFNDIRIGISNILADNFKRRLEFIWHPYSAMEGQVWPRRGIALLSSAYALHRQEGFTRCTLCSC